MILKASGTLMQRHASLPSRYAPSADRYATPVNFEEPVKPGSMCSRPGTSATTAEH